MEILTQVSMALQEGDDQQVSTLINTLLEEGVKPEKIIDKGLIAGMDIIGIKFKAHEIFLPDVLLAAKAMEIGMEKLKPLLSLSSTTVIGKIVLGTVHGDLHDIGKNLVAIMLKGAGFEVIDLGKNVEPKYFVETALKAQADIIGLSTLLTTTMPVMKNVVDLLRKSDSSRNVKVIIGGAPTSKEFALDIGADAYAFDAVSAVDRIKILALS
ncbi:MAG: corrinoid protein [Candidatus Marinimicrobia bacterium]|nr:corrinoid protein [Candidatus Neomarinimicrobiota bacterium]